MNTPDNRLEIYTVTASGLTLGVRHHRREPGVHASNDHVDKFAAQPKTAPPSSCPALP